MTYAERVHDLFLECLYRTEELQAIEFPTTDGVPADAVIVDGIAHRVAFHPGRVAESKEKVRGLIREIVSHHFLRGDGGGGGYSFLNLPFDKSGEHWCEQVTAGELVELALATGWGGYCLPREFWGSLPGSAPYVWFDA